jgi:hypothetical protein
MGVVRCNALKILLGALGMALRAQELAEMKAQCRLRRRRSAW